jgi:hypothetical protein
LAISVRLVREDIVMPRLPSRLLTCLLLAALAGPAGAAGVDLSWNACTAEGGVQNKTFACNTNTGSSVLVGSFALASDMANVIGIEANVDITAEADSLPAWWRFAGPNACRSGLTGLFNFASDPNLNCTDAFESQATGALAGYHTYWTNPQVPGANPATAQALLVAAVPVSMAQQLSAGIEYYGFKLILSFVKTVGGGTCTGCSTPVCITLSQIKVVASDNSSQVLANPLVASTATWQSAEQCPGALAARNVTWGQVRCLMH